MTHPGANLQWPKLMRLEAAAVCDCRQVFMPGALLIQVEGPRKLRVLAMGRPEEVARHPASAAARLERYPDGVLIPGLVNAHAHLDLTHIGPRPFEPERGFGGFVDLVRRERRVEAQEIAASVRLGVEKSLAAGVVAVGDIAGAVQGAASSVATEALAGAGLAGVSFVEYFAIGSGEQRGIRAFVTCIESLRLHDPRVRVGMSPHAPNTVSRDMYLAGAVLGELAGLRLATHVAETPAERDFVEHGTGPNRAFLQKIGLWADSVLQQLGHGRSPVEHVLETLHEWRQGGPMLVHVNDCSDNDLRAIVAARPDIAYCPSASAYFEAPKAFGPHRYREMLDQEINVALGTDSVINQPLGELSILAEMGLLYQRDGTDAATLLAMGTVNGAAALGLVREAFEFQEEGPLAGVVVADVEDGRKNPAVHPLGWVLAGEDPRAKLLYIGTDYC